MSQQNSKFITILGWVATATALGMYFAYIPQIQGNLAGNKTSAFQPLVAAINCTLWVWYGLKVKNYPVAAANSPGILFGFVAFLTAL